MFKRILPKEYGFFDLFEGHGELIIGTCNELLTLTTGAVVPQEAARRIKDLEHRADEVTHQCIEALHRTFITPIDRPDIHQLIKRLDDIIDSIDSAATRIHLYGIESMRSEAREMAEILILCAESISRALRGLRNLKKTKIINEQCLKIHDLENKGDEVLRSALFRLFKENDPIQIIKWKEIFERLEKAVDRCEDVANIIEGVTIAAS